MMGEAFSKGMIIFHGNIACLSYINKHNKIAYEIVHLPDRPPKNKKPPSFIFSLMRIYSNLEQVNIWTVKMLPMLPALLFSLSNFLAFMYLPAILGIEWRYRLIGGGVFFLLTTTVQIITSMCFPNIRKFHGAEHKAINCVDSNQPLTVENIQAQTPISKGCSTTTFFYISLLVSIGYVCIPFERPALRLGALIILNAIAYFLTRHIHTWMLSKKTLLRKAMLLPGLYLQKVTTAEPDKKHILVGLCAAKNVIMKLTGIVKIYEGHFIGYRFSGNCIHRSPNGNEYVGDVRDGKTHGNGKMTYASGGWYDGEWKNGAKAGPGYGVLHLAADSVYTGPLYNGRPHGYGTIAFPNGDHLEAEWIHGIRIKPEPIAVETDTNSE